MKKCWIIGVLAVVLPLGARAQVEKRVEVTKAYEPNVEPATKLRIEPRMDDTVTMRPEIDYTITPLTLQTTLDTRPIRPAQLSYWEFNTPSRFYLKAGAGVPLHSVADFYATSAHSGAGYLTGYLNHEGRYADLRNDFGVKRSALRMSNRVGVAAGRYFGRRLLEGDLHYRHRADRRYGAFLPYDVEPAPTGSKIGYADADLSLRFGDDFQNLTRTNFEVAADGSLFFDRSDPMTEIGRGRQTDLGLGARIGRAFSGHRVTLSFDFRMWRGAGALAAYRQHRYHAAARYAKTFRRLRVEAGADFYNDRFRNRAASGRRNSSNYIFPYARLELGLGGRAFKPFVEVDGSLAGNDFRSLSERNPYVGSGAWLAKSTADYNLRGGLTGHSANNLFNYRVYAAFTVSDDHLYWTVPAVDFGAPEAFSAGYFRPLQGRQTCLSVAGEATWRPVTSLVIDLAVRFGFYNDEEPLENGDPRLTGHVGLRYDGRKIRFGVKTLVQSARKWSISSADPMQTAIVPVGCVEVPFEVDLQADFEWMMTSSLALFVEGRNLLCRDRYLWPLFPEYGAQALVGVRWNF